MNTNTGSSNYPSHQTGPTAGQAVRHPVESARAEADSLSRGTGATGTDTGVYSTGRGGVGNMGSTTTGTSGVGEYGQGVGAGAGLTSGTHTAGQHPGHHGHGEHVYTGTGTHVPGTGIGTGEGQLGSTGRAGVGDIGPGTAATGAGAGVGSGVHTGHHTGGQTSLTGAQTGTHTGVGAKPSIGEKIKGSVEVMAGKVTNDPQRVNEGEQLKEGIHPTQTGVSRPI